MNAYPPRRWAHMRRACAAWSLDRLEACSITQTLAPARSTKSEPRDALSDACNMTSRKEGALGRRRGRSCRGRALPAGVPVVEQLPAGVADRYERVDVDDVTGAALGGDVDRRRPGDGTIDDVAVSDADGLEEDRDRGRGRYRATDVDVRELARTEDEALRRIDVHSGHIKRARERAEVMRVSERRESGAERALE